jgi:signal peptidase II
MAAVGLAAAVLDVATKSWAFAAIPMHEDRAVVGDLVLFRPQYNSAGPWSWGQGWEWLKWGLPVVSVVAVFVIGRFWLQTDPRDRVKGAGFALILGGALGNLWDRALTLLGAYDGVRDFLVVRGVWFDAAGKWGGDFPTFNLADTWITIGVVFVGWRMITEKEPAPAPAAPAPSADEVRA